MPPGVAERRDALDGDAVRRELDQLQRAVERGGDQVARDFAVEGGGGVLHQAVGRRAELRQRLLAGRELALLRQPRGGRT